MCKGSAIFQVNPTSRVTMNNSSPLVSVIVPCYNYSHLLPETIASLQQQKYQNWECIVVDDGSKDATRQVCADLMMQEPRVRYIHQLNGGLSNARNSGLKAAQGSYVQLLDADDLLGQCKLEMNVALLEAQPDVDIVYGKVRYFRHGEAGIFSCSIDMLDQPWMPCISGKGTDVLRELMRENIMVVNAPMFRRRLTLQVGEFDESLRACEDWDYWIRCAVAGATFCYDDADEAAALVRAHATSMMNDNSLLREARIAMRLKANTLTAVARDSDIKAINTYNLLVLISQDDFQQLYQGKVLLGVKGVLTKMIRWKNYKFFMVNGLYWLSKRFRND